MSYDVGTEEYHDWVDRFFEYALLYDMSVNMALDHASWETWQNYFGSSPLQNFKAHWPNIFHETYPNCNMTVYGNGGVYLWYYEPGLVDVFDDDWMDGSKWQELEANGASVDETGGELAVTVPSGNDQAQAGYVSKDVYDVKDFEAAIDVSEFDDLDEMILQICTTETTGSDPYDEDDWYRILKVGYDSKVYAQNCIDGVVSTKVATTWAGSTGELTIDVCDGAIAFYEDGDLVYSEPYALPSYDCYTYAFTSTFRSRSSGTDMFDKFSLAPTPSFWDYFEDANNIYGWTVDSGGWSVSNVLAHRFLEYLSLFVFLFLI